MTERQLRKVGRADLRKLLQEQKQENEDLRLQLQQAQEQLQSRQLSIDQSGTLAEAALKLSGIFDAAQSACQYYTESIRTLSGRQEEICRNPAKNATACWSKPSKWQKSTGMNMRKNAADI